MTYSEILEKVKEVCDNNYYEAAYEMPYIGEEGGLGEVKQVFSSGGEDRGSDWRRVYHFVDHDVYIQAQGYYQSYNGTEFYNEWDSFSEVKPVQKTITVYS